MKSPYPLYKSSNPLFENANQLDIFLNKPFWIWDQEAHNSEYQKTAGHCCFNHIIGLPIKNNKQYPIFPFQEQIYNAVQDYDNIWILKSRGIGITSILIRWVTWKILSGSELENKSIFIISGTRQEFANHIKQKMQDLFTDKFPLLRLESKFTELWLKNTWIKVFPTKNIEMVRGYTDVAIIWVDESDHMEPSVQEELFYSIGPYQEKSHAKIILSSTANRPDGLMATIEKQPGDKWRKLKLDYSYALGTIYDPKEIEKMKNDVEFPREMECKYLGKMGNVFLPSQIQTCIELGSEYSIDKIPVSLYTLKSVGIDPGFSSSATGIVVLEHIKPDNLKDKIRVIETYNIEKGDPSGITQLCWDIWKRNKWMNTFFFIDGSNRAMVNLLKIRWQESLNWESKDSFGSNIRIRPVNFSTEHRNMLSNLHAVISKSYLAIDEKHDKLITSLRTAYAEELNLDKKATSYSDLLDALRLALKGYDIK